MKNISLILLFVSQVALGQIVSDKTNSIRLNVSKMTSKEKIELPVISWISPSSLYTNSQERRVEVKASIKSPAAIQSVQLFVSDGLNQIPKAGKKMDIKPGSFSYELDEEMNLKDGENNIGVLVETVKGGSVADYRQVLYGLEAISKAVDINRKDYALLIATDKYDQWPDLVNPIFDAESIKEELQSVYGFETEVLLNPTQDELLVKLKDYSAKSYRPQDQLFIFVAGHGQYDDTFKEGYLVTKNSLKDDDAKTSYVAHSVLRNIVNNIPCEHILLTLDVCFSGTFDPVIARRALYEDVDNSEMLVRLLSKKTRKYLTSGGKEYVSDGIAGQHSPFARRFLETLKGRGGADRIITMPEIYAAMQALKTLPRTGSFGDDEKDSDFVFVVAGN